MSPISSDNAKVFSVGVALDGAGWHPAAWREPGATPESLFTAAYWQSLVTTAEAAGFDYATIDDSLQLRSRGALDGELPARPRAGL